MKNTKHARIFTNEIHEPYRIEVTIDDAKTVIPVANCKISTCHRAINVLAGNCPRSIVQVFGNDNDKREC